MYIKDSNISKGKIIIKDLNSRFKSIVKEFTNSNIA